MKSICKMTVREFLSSKRGGISSVISTVVTIILVLGLISYAVLNQVAGAKDVGDKASVEQMKINLLLQQPDTVTGSTVKMYAGKTGALVSISTAAGGTMELANVLDSALFTMTKTYNANGELASVAFKQVDLGK